MRKSAVLAFTLLICFRAAVAAAAPSSPQTTVPVPTLAGRVNDLAHLLDAAAVAELEAKLADYEKTTGNQLVLLTVPTLGGFPLEEYSLKVAEAWKLGRKGVSNGVLLFVAKEERKIRIEVGYGLEPSLTDAATSHIISGIMTPRFRAEDYKGGILAAFEAMMQAAEGNLVLPAAAGGGSRHLPLVWFALLALLGYGFMGMITWFSLFMKGAGVIFYLMLFAGYGLAGSALNIRGTKIGYALFFIFAFGFPVAKVILGKTAFGQKKIKAAEARQASYRMSGGSRSFSGSRSATGSSPR